VSNACEMSKRSQDDCCVERKLFRGRPTVDRKAEQSDASPEGLIFTFLKPRPANWTSFASCSLDYESRLLKDEG
jgi:hypothetical protein